MKKVYILVLVTLTACTTNHICSQGIYQFWGHGYHGGSNDEGLVYTTKADGTALTNRSLMQLTSPGYFERLSDFLEYNSKLYVLSSRSGLRDNGLLVRYDPATDAYSAMADMDSIGGNDCHGRMVVYNNKFYGVADGGTNSAGIIFEYDPSTNKLKKKFDFPASVPGGPSGGLVLYNNEFYGYAGNTVIYKFNPANNGFAVLKVLASGSGSAPSGTMVLYNAKLYGVMRTGGSFDSGVLFEYNPGSNLYVTKYTFGLNDNGSGPVGSLVIYNNLLYGQTSSGGVSNKGLIFHFDPAGNSLTNLDEFTTTTGYSLGIGLSLLNAKMYTITSLGGGGSGGSIIEFNPANNTITKKKDITEATGSYSRVTMAAYNNKLYSTFNADGPSHGGVLFEYNPTGNTLNTQVALNTNKGYTPVGIPLYYNGKLYGFGTSGGTNGAGVFYEYELSTGVYTVRRNMATDERPRPQYEGGILYNGDIYGTMPTNFGTAIYKYDISAHTFTKIFTFEGGVGGSFGKMVVYNNKFYGTCSFGGTNTDGVIFEFDPATNAYAIKANFNDPVTGKNPLAGLIYYNGHMYGTCGYGGANNRGTIFEFNPATNSITTLHHILVGFEPAGLTGVGSKLYGTNKFYGTGGNGNLFEYDINTGVYAEKGVFTNTTGNTPFNKLRYNGATNCLYGITIYDGLYGHGSLFEYNITDNILTPKTFFDGINGGYVETITGLELAPALIAPGTPGNCVTAGSSVVVDATNNTKWIQFTNEKGDAVAEIYPNGQNLGLVAVNYYVHNGATRQKDGAYYLDRNFTITAANPFTNPVNVRCYIKTSEFESLKNTPGSGIVGIGGLSLFKNNDGCSPAIINPVEKLATTIIPWGGDHAFLTTVTSFSSFYIAGANSSLPIHIESFSGKKEIIANQLEWKASCSNNVQFVIERSADGNHFQSIGTIKASPQDCNYGFHFADNTPMASTYYRLKMIEPNGTISYSAIILLQRDGKMGTRIVIYPNPVSGQRLNLQVATEFPMQLDYKIIDAIGRTVLTRKSDIGVGSHSIPISVEHMSKGVYFLQYNDGNGSKTIRFVRE
ncbi:MAG: choice-of-anchor tandem repeat GloVer-containing protein [Bacteroidota bacterium]